MWLQELIDEYTTPKHKPTQSKIDRLARLFADVDPDVMRIATDDYILNAEHTFFPRVADLRPFVDKAKENGRGDMPYSDEGKGTTYSDADLYHFELRRGTMPPIEQIEAEAQAARRQVVAMLAGKHVVNGLLVDKAEEAVPA